MRGVTVDPAGRINLRLFKAAEVPSVDGNSQSTTDFLLISGGFASDILYREPGLARARNESQGPGLLNPRSGFRRLPIKCRELDTSELEYRRTFTV
jgi:hypothetical protein